MMFMPSSCIPRVAYSVFIPFEHDAVKVVVGDVDFDEMSCLERTNGSPNEAAI